MVDELIYQYEISNPKPLGMIDRFVKIVTCN